MKRVKALICNSISKNFQGLSVQFVTLPKINSKDVLIEVRASSVNFPDLLMTQGKYQHKPELPFILGMEGSGVVKEIGTEVSKFKVGDEVCFGAWKNGTFTEYIVIPQDNIRIKPKKLNFFEAAAFQTAYLTAYVALVRLGKVSSGENLLIHGASGGVGMAAVQLGNALGARVITTGTSNKKLEKTIEWGASNSILINKKNSPSFKDEVKNLTAGKGADVIYDPVGGDVFDQSTRCINWGGRILIIGFTSGRIPSVPVNIPLIKGFSVIGVRAGEYGRRNPDKAKENYDSILNLANEKKINPYICKIFSLDEGKKALLYMAQRKVIGKIVISMK